jgi:hypothetical protein
MVTAGALLLWAIAMYQGGGRQAVAPASGKSEGPAQEQAKSAARGSRAPKRKIPCKTPENASLCYWTHGRLSMYEGNPTYRIWKIGTRRILGVLNGPSRFPLRISTYDEDVFNPELPSNLERAYIADQKRWDKRGSTGYGRPDIFAEFEVCPLEPETKGEMQSVCVESADDVVVQSGWH